MISVSELAIYPLKSSRQISVEEAFIGSTGFIHDRQWLLVDEENNKFMTQRHFPEMVKIRATLRENGLGFEIIDGNQSLFVQQPHLGEAREVLATVWNDQCGALDAGDEAAQWFSSYLNKKCRLLFQHESFIRPVDQRFSRAEDQTSFADGFPFLLTTEASLADLNSRLEQAVPMKRFRPNIVLRGAEAFMEDNWKTLQIGEVVFRVAKPCSRCVMTTVDTDAGVKTGKDPLATLAGYRRSSSGVIFGQNLIHNQQGVIRVGDRVTILD